jgi:hypothetical protein
VTQKPFRKLKHAAINRLVWILEDDPVTWGAWTWAFEWRKLVCERLGELVDDLLMQSSC